MAWVLDPLHDTTSEDYLPPWEQQRHVARPPRPGLRCVNCREPRPPRQPPPPFWTVAAFGLMALLAVALVLTVVQWATGGTESTVAPRRSGRVLEDDDGTRGDVQVAVSGCPGCTSKCRASEAVGAEAVVCVQRCSDAEFACKSNRCVDRRTRCDGAADCDDMSDETACPCDEDVAFRCGLNTSCLPLSRRCDGVADCWDMADEVDCPRDECPPPAEVGGRKGYLCHGWHCVPPELVCDGREDCEDGGDEGGCPRAANKD